MEAWGYINLVWGKEVSLATIAGPNVHMLSG